MKRLILAYIFGAIGFGIGAFSMIGYLARVQSFYDWHQVFGSIAMAFPTAISVTCVSLSCLLMTSVVLDKKTVPAARCDQRPIHAGFTRREAMAATVALAATIIAVAACVQTGEAEAVRAELTQRERAVIDREAQFETVRLRYDAALRNQIRYWQAARDRWGGLATFVTAFIPPEQAEVKR